MINSNVFGFTFLAGSQRANPPTKRYSMLNLNQVESPSESLLRFKKRLGLYIHCGAFCLVVPFAFLQYFSQNTMLAAAIFTFMIFDVLIIYLLIKKDAYLFNGWGLAVLAATLVCYSTSITGMVGALWSYVAILIFFFLLHWKQAAFAVTVFVIAEAVLALNHIELSLWFRLVATMVLSAIITGIFSWLLTEKQHQLVTLATTDPLTGCANRLQLNELLNSAAYNFHRYRIPASLIVLDLDNFKQINDTQGHAIGDQVLIKFAALMASRTRQSDKLFRYGGEEFIILLPNTRINDAYRLAESLREATEAHSFDVKETITTSGGVAEITEGEGWDHWLNRADAALFMAKREGRNRIEFGEAPKKV